MGFVMVGVAGLAVPFAWAQSDGGHGKLTRVAPPSRAQAGSEDFDRDAWKKQITTGDLSEREQAFDRLSNLARQDPAAREALEAWSRDESDAGLAWTSRLLLREVDRALHGWMMGGAQPGWEMFGRDFDFNGFSQRFEDLDSLFGDLRTEWDGMLRHLPHPSTGGKSGRESARSMTLQSGPDGVTCKVTEMVDGQEQTKEYTANSMDELLEANPELRDTLGHEGPMVFTFPNGGGRARLSIPRRGDLHGRSLQVPPAERPDVTFEDAGAGTAGEPRTDRLGIFCAPMDDDTAEHLDLHQGEGLLVQSVQPGSIANVLGLRTGDVVVEINGTTIHSADDVKKVLTDRAEGAEVSVVVVGSEGRRTLNWKPAPKKSDATPESKSGSRKL